MQQPPWLAPAWAELGQKEVAGSSDNRRILAFYRDAGHPEIAHDETAWCAAFVGACLVRSGIDGTASLMARSYLSWGEPIEEPRIGAVAVLRRGNDPSLGHVAFLVGECEGGLVLLGGNQGDAVSVARFDRDALLGLRWPASAAPASPSVIFDAALAHVLAMEGGFDDDPLDPGGPTNQGLTLVDLAAARGIDLSAATRATLLAELKVITPAEVRAIYLERYWRPSLADRLAAPLAVMHFDCAVNQGIGTAARILQEALAVSIDGEIGPDTLAMAAHADPLTVLDRLAAIRRRRYRDLPAFSRFGRGWLARVDATLAKARSVVATPVTPPSPQQQGERSMSNAAPAPPPAAPVEEPVLPKWWGDSMTIWGTLVTAAATVIPAFGPLIGLDLTPALVKQLGGQTLAVAQAVAGLAGTVIAIYGRARATQPLMRRDLSLKL